MPWSLELLLVTEQGNWGGIAKLQCVKGRMRPQARMWVSTARVLVRKKAQVCLLLSQLCWCQVRWKGWRRGWKALGVPPVEQPLSLQLTAQGQWVLSTPALPLLGIKEKQVVRVAPAAALVAGDLGGALQVSTSSQWQCQGKVTLPLEVALHWEELCGHYCGQYFFGLCACLMC